MTLLTTDVYARELAIADEEVLEEGEYESLRLAAGNRVVTKATVDGLSFVAGNDVTFEGNVSYGFYGGNNITIAGTINKDAFIAGNSITISNNAVIGRDLYVAGSSIKIDTDIGRDLNAGAIKIDISGITINGDAHLDSDELIMDENTIIIGKLSYLEKTKVTGLDKVKYGSVETRKVKEVDVKVNRMDSIYDFIISLIGAYIVMAVLFYIVPKSREKLDKVELKFGDIAKTTGIGLVVLCIVPLICLIAMFTGFLTPIALITVCLYVIAIYLGTLLSSYIVGSLINTKLFKNNNPYLSLLVGILVVRLIILIPVIGFWIGAIMLLHGLGLVYKYITASRKK